MNAPRPAPTPMFGFLFGVCFSTLLGYIMLKPISIEEQTVVEAALSSLSSLIFWVLMWYYATKEPKMLFPMFCVILGFSVGDGIVDLLRAAPWWYALVATLARLGLALVGYSYFVRRTKKGDSN